MPRRCFRIDNWCCQQIRTDEELRVANVVIVEGKVVRVLEEDGAEDGASALLHDEYGVIVF